MKKFLCMLLASMLCVSVFPALAEENVIRVSGNATVSLPADTATIQIGVITRKATIQEAQQTNQELMHAVMTAILETGVGESDVATSQFEVYSASDYGYDPYGNETTMQSYEVSNMLSVTIRDLNLIGAVLDAAMSAGANTTYGISFSSTQENDAYQKALTRAVEDAAQKAEILAFAAGKKLGDLRMIDASEQNYYYGISNVFDEKTAESGISIVAGDVFVTAGVILEYDFE